MKRIKKLGSIVAAVAAFCIAGLECAKATAPYALTVKKYSSNVDMAAVVAAECGPGCTVADWKEISAHY